MKPPSSIIGGVFGSTWLQNAPRRRVVLAILAVIFAFLCVWPEHYAAETELMPQDNGGGLSGVLAEQSSGAILSLGALTGNKPTIEADLTISRSHAVLAKTLVKLDLVGKPGYQNPRAAELKIKKKIGIIAIRGSIVQVTTHDSNPRFARDLAAAVASSIQGRLAEISLEQAAVKRRVTLNRLADATTRLSQAQAALDQFRISNKLPAPEQQLGAGIGILAGLQAQLQAKQVALRSLEQVATPDNIQVRVLQSQVSSLQQQVAQAQNTQQNPSGSGLAGIAVINTQYYNLYRNEKTAEILYTVYSRYLEELTIDEMSANQAMYIIEPAFVDPARQINIIPAALCALTIMTGIFAEFYFAERHRGRRGEAR